jgi:excisionase family DNA binding protein
MSEELALRLGQAARLLNLSRRKLWELARDGRIPHVRLPGRSGKRATLLFPIAELNRWLSQSTLPQKETSNVH